MPFLQEPLEKSVERIITGSFLRNSDMQYILLQDLKDIPHDQVYPIVVAQSLVMSWNSDKEFATLILSIIIKKSQRYPGESKYAYDLRLINETNMYVEAVINIWDILVGRQKFNGKPMYDHNPESNPVVNRIYDDPDTEGFVTLIATMDFSNSRGTYCCPILNPV